MPGAERVVLFVCEHGAAKSVLAAELLARAAHSHGLPVNARATGVKPSEAIAEGVVTLFPERAWILRARRPRRVTQRDVETAAITVTFNLAPGDLPVQPHDLLTWDDVPAVSEDPVAARDVIDRHVAELIRRL